MSFDVKSAIKNHLLNHGCHIVEWQGDSWEGCNVDVPVDTSIYGEYFAFYFIGTDNWLNESVHVYEKDYFQIMVDDKNYSITGCAIYKIEFPEYKIIYYGSSDRNFTEFKRVQKLYRL